MQPLPHDLCRVRCAERSAVAKPGPRSKQGLQMLMCLLSFFVNLGQIPPVLRWLRYFSTLGYTLEALSVNEVGSGLQIVVS